MGSIGSTKPAATSFSNKKLIDELRRSKLFQRYEDAFSEATGLPLALRPVTYWQLAHRGKKHENPYCALMAERPATLAVCLGVHDELVRRTKDLPHSVTCPFSLTETAVPVKLGHDTIGFLRVGQVWRRAPGVAATQKVSEALASCGVAFTSKIREAWERNPLIPAAKYRAMGRLLTFFADQLSALSNQLVTEQRHAEPVLVARAREYIEQNKTGALSLGMVAAAAGASVFHFCKVFHAATGLKFTDYVSRVRVEDARTQLLNPLRRISEIAYGVGFKSLTHFNRTFKRVFGESPSEFRAKMSMTR
jgi:AraC-like DNA-binding protein/ligand-binding sensor protein